MSKGAEREPSELLVVGIGASAGGLEALGELVRHVPLDTMAFIVVQHLAPHHDSLLTQLLARSSKVAVATAVDGTRLEANHLYVIPPNADLAVMHGIIHLITPALAGPRLPIDYLFRSLADDKGPLAIGIVLSGTGTDGTFGLEAIKAAGGITFVQDPGSAKYDGMPRSALASGCADFSLTPKEIGNELARIAKRPRGQRAARPAEPDARVQDLLGKLFVFIRAEFGNDLTHYKIATVGRRVERRMTLHKIERLEEYVRYVQTNPEELHALYKDMLITVTSFFRDPEAFRALQSKVFPRLVESKDGKGSIRVWVPACATGEEAYSIAMALIEVCEDKGRDRRIQIFGTDVEDEAIQYARRGVYPANIAADVAPERLARFFVRKDDQYQISRRVRDMVVFSRQNLLKDAPFSRLALVSCRNLLIYLQPAAQKKVLRLLHYALEPAGFLVLGTSESVGDAPDLFSLVDRKNKIYAKKQLASLAGLEVGFGGPQVADISPRPAVDPPNVDLQRVADRRVLELHGPPGVIVNEDLEVLQFRGHVGPYLDPTPGTATFKLLKLARFELHVELKRALQQALSQARRVTTEVRYQVGDEPKAVMLDVVPLADPGSSARCLLVLFQSIPVAAVTVVASAADGSGGDSEVPALSRRIEDLERELTATREYLQTTIEEKESTHEELKAANEELQSSNEELQSTNEELETSKEEMQSTNEELTTVNEELQNRMAELSLANDDLHNILTGVDNAVVMVSIDLRIRRYTLAAEKLFNLIPGDVGRSIACLETFLGVGTVVDKVSSVVDSLATVEEEILASNQRWYALRITPYKTLDHVIRGALVALIDIDVRKRAAETTRNVGEYAARFLGAIGHPLLIVDARLRVVWVNESFLATFQLTPDETLGSLLSGLGVRQWADPTLRAHVERAFTTSRTFRDYEMRLRLDGRGDFVMRVGGSQIPASSETPLVLLSMEPGDLRSPRGKT